MQFIFQDTTNVPPDTEQNVHEDDEFQGNAYSNAVGEIQKSVGNFFKDNSDILWYPVGMVLLIGYFWYFGWCMYSAAKRDLMGDEETVPYMSYKKFHEFPPKKLIIIKKKETKY